MYGVTPRGRVARLKQDGTLDATFDPGTGADALVRSVAEYQDGKILIGGNFLTVSGVSRPHIARLIGDAYLTISAAAAKVILSWPTNWSGYVLQSATNLQPPVTWVDWTNGIATNAGNYTLTNPASGPVRFYRLKK